MSQCALRPGRKGVKSMATLHRANRPKRANRAVPKPPNHPERFNHPEHFNHLCAVKLFSAVHHHVRGRGWRLQPREVADVGVGLDEGPGYRVLVARHRADDAHARLLCLLQLRHQQLQQEEVAEVVDLETHLVTIVGEAGLGVGREVDGGVAHEAVELAARQAAARESKRGEARRQATAQI